MDRALNGVEEPLYSYGKLVGTRRRYNDRLLMFILRNRAPERFADGAPKALNAIGRMELERHKKQWRAEWEAERAARNVSTAELCASIDRKVEAVRRRLEAERAAIWAQLSEETRAAWDHFAALKDRDLAALGAEAATRALPAPKKTRAGDAEETPKPGPDFRKWQPPAPPPATTE